jgi:hypothetical protein
MPRDFAPGDIVGPWILGALMALLSLFGLVMASGATDAGFYGVGLLFFLFGVLFNFGLIARHVGR